MAEAAVFFFEPGDQPLTLAPVQGHPVLDWAAGRLWRDGVRRFFAAASPGREAEIRACFPAGAEVVISALHSDLMAFLDTDDETAVLPRAVLPFSAAGVGLVYAAPGRELREAWRERLTNQLQGVALLDGWIPLYGPETLAELEPLFRPETEPGSAIR